MSGPTGDRMIRVDMTRQTVTVEPFPDEWKLLGGRGLSARILLNECDPQCDPLGPDNVLVMAPGVISGTAAPTSGRISIGGKSPLTGGIKEANAGGNPGQDLMKLGYRAVIVKGQPSDSEKRYAVDVTADGATVKEVPDCKGMWNYALIDHLAKSYTKTASFISIGPAGEQRLTGASVACTDQAAAREAYRAVIAAGIDWLLQTDAVQHDAILTTGEVTQRGVPVVFRWNDPDVPDSASVTLVRADSTIDAALRFDVGGIALLPLDPGIYRWSARGVSDVGGIFVVEDYSDEFHPRAVTLEASVSESAFTLVVRRARDAWWVFVVAVLALLFEWGWRQRRGLP